MRNEQSTERDLPDERGSREAFDAVFRENHKRVFSVAMNFFGGSSELAEDITQQVFLKIFAKLEDFRGEAEIATWLYRITVNACIDEQRKRRRFSFIADLLGFREPRVKKTQDDAVYRREISAAVQKAIGSIDQKFRLPLILKYSEGLSYREIAEVLDISEGTVASRLNRGHKLLARKLEHLKDEI